MPHSHTTFQRWMRCLIIVFILLMTYIIIADRYVPLTSESRVQGYVVQIAPEVSGIITQVDIKNNQTVTKGEHLLSIDDQKYRLAVDQAQVAVEQAHQQEQALYAQASVAQANIATSQANYNNAHRDFNRINKLAKKQLVSASMRDNAYAKYQMTQANLAAAKQQAVVIQTQLGTTPGQSTLVLAAENALAQAKLNLTHTQVIAPSNGVITNLQVDIGTMANANQPMLTFIPTDSMWVTADFREKSIANFHSHSMAYVAYDALPGQVFPLTINNRDFGVAAAQQVANGHLTNIVTSNRWVRDAQRVRVNFISEQPLPPQLFVGSRATVVVYPQQDPIWKLFAKIEIHLASALHFIY
ncbi:HlyD family secretion protein [Photobacterium phosphoreum]|uniref:HlyD family secretion protein n=1 Tax=Photobacterium phosphoreum TaxID=659 RepID=UPI0005D455A5|nr:HlyD family secretion protein [Photobacterium phosphoreum]KJF86053.1 multidrug transporter [Photobacterium phosphoreum]PQJ86120.1 multidrug transporter [Photobacterium phosphoreum]